MRKKEMEIPVPGIRIRHVKGTGHPPDHLISGGTKQLIINGKSKDKEYVKELSDTEFDHDPNAH